MLTGVNKSLKQTSSKFPGAEMVAGTPMTMTRSPSTVSRSQVGHWIQEMCTIPCDNFLNTHWCVCTCLCADATCVQRPQRPEEGSIPRIWSCDVGSRPMRVRKQTLEEQQLLLVTKPSLQGPLSLLKRKSAFFFSFLQFSQTQASEYSLQRFKDITSWPVCQEQEWRLDVNPY